MAIVDRTADWLRVLENYVVIGTPLAPDTPETRHFRHEDAPERPARHEWSPGMLGSFTSLFHTLQLFAAGEPNSLFRKSLFLRPPPAGSPRYDLVTGNREVRGRLYLLEAVPPDAPFTADLLRFVAYVPAHYTRNGDSGHHAWVHFTPVWDERRGRSPRAAAVRREYPDSIWTHYYVASYLFEHRLLANFSASHVNAVLFLPVHRFTTVEALQPLSHSRPLMEILRPLFAALETLVPSMRARDRTRSGSVSGVGVSCFSFGAFYSSRLFRHPQPPNADFEKLRAGVFLDGVTSESRTACQVLVSPSTGWLRTLLPGTSDVPKRLALFQQSRSHSDFVEPFPRAVNLPPLLPGDTLDLLASAPSWRNVAKFHRVHTQDMMCDAREPNCRNPRHGYMDWHGHIHALFAETAFGFCRDCFLW